MGKIAFTQSRSGKGCKIYEVVEDLSGCKDGEKNIKMAEEIKKKCEGKTAAQIKEILEKDVKGIEKLSQAEMDELVADLAHTVGISGIAEDSREKINEINQLIQDAATKRTLEILESQSQTAAGPCLSVIYDPLTGKIAYGQNFKTSATGKEQYYKWLENDADPLIKDLVSEYKTKIDNGEIILSEFADFRLAAHSEIVALDEILKHRRSLGLPVDKTTLSELFLHNVDLTKAFKTGNIIPKIRCEHCRYLTDGINILNHN
ncbi:MAG TPA: hypothetical protein PK566_02875 [Pseudobacteroides sp.]|nr:hypothetical protein [Pseudobacteroides sp.]